MFSSRTPRDLQSNRLAELVGRKRAAGIRLLDLTESNPTRVGLSYPAERILASLADARALRYEPDPKGLASARDAVVDFYGERGIAVERERVVLTASTSEAYTFLFKLLADPGDEVLVPVPSYPLFEHLARAEGVAPIPYPLVPDRGWRIDLDALVDAVTTRTKAVVVVSPNNPTGSCLKRSELARLVEICAAHGLALVCDEVFADFVYGPDPERVSSVAACDDVLTFALSGLSKVALLPQLKLGWIVVNGPPGVLPEAIARLEFVADLFLSVGSPVQWALRPLLGAAPETGRALLERVQQNRAWLEGRASGESVCRVLPSEAGWYAILRVPRVLSEEELVLDVLERLDVLVHPGYFFDFATEGWLVASLIATPDDFRAGAGLLLDYLDSWRG